MTDEEYDRNMAGAETIRTLSEPHDEHFWRGYIRGMRRAKHGDTFGTDSEHTQWLTIADRPHDENRRYLGLGYRAGLEMISVKEGIKRLQEIAAKTAFSAKQAKAGAVMSDARRAALRTNGSKPRPGAKGKPRPRLAQKNAIAWVCITSRVSLTSLGADTTEAQATAFCNLAEPLMAQAVLALYPGVKQVEVDILPAQDGLEEGITCSAANADHWPVYTEEEKLAEEMARVFAEVLAKGEWK